MTSNPLGELDMELDAVMETEVSAGWSAYRWWTFAWALLFAIWMIVGSITLVLILADEPFGVAMATLVVTVLAWSVVSGAGFQARERWRRAERLQTGR